MKCGTWFLAFGAVLSASQSYAGSSTADPENAAQVQRGSILYVQSCSSCHGSRLQRQPDRESQNPVGTYPARPHDINGHCWHRSDNLLFRHVALGGREAIKDIPDFKSAMPGFCDRLSEQDIWDLRAFIKSRRPEPARAYQEAVTANDT